MCWDAVTAFVQPLMTFQPLFYHQKWMDKHQWDKITETIFIRCAHESVSHLLTWRNLYYNIIWCLLLLLLTVLTLTPSCFQGQPPALSALWVRRGPWTGWLWRWRLWARLPQWQQVTHIPSVTCWPALMPLSGKSNSPVLFPLIIFIKKNLISGYKSSGSYFCWNFIM